MTHECKMFMEAYAFQESAKSCLSLQPNRTIVFMYMQESAKSCLYLKPNRTIVFMYTSQRYFCSRLYSILQSSIRGPLKFGLPSSFYVSGQ